MTSFRTILLASAFLIPASHAVAQQAGTWSASLGVTRIAPSVDSDGLTSPAGVASNGRVDVNSNTQITGAVNYMVTDNINIHVPIGFGFKHDITGAGALAGVGKVAETKALPITLLAQYRFFEANARFRPYVGAGMSYVKFYKEQGTALLTALTNPGGTPTGVSFRSRFAPAVHLGGVFSLDSKWFVEGSYTKTFLKTRGTLSTGQTIDVGLDPDCFALQLGYRF